MRYVCPNIIEKIENTNNLYPTNLLHMSVYNKGQKFVEFIDERNKVVLVVVRWKNAENFSGLHDVLVL